MPLADYEEENPYRSPEADAGSDQPPAPSAGGEAAGARYVMEPLTRASGWITFAAVLLIIYGASTIFILIGIVPLWIGIMLIQAQSRIKEGHRSGDLDKLREGSELLRKSAKVWGIFTIVAVALTFIIYGLMIAVFIAGAASGEFR